MRAGREIISPQRVEQVLIAGEGLNDLQSLVVLGKRIFGEGAAYLVEHPGFCFLQRNFGERRQLASKIAVNHHFSPRHARRDLAEQIAPVGQSGIGDSADDHPFVFRRDRKKTVDQLFSFGRVRSDCAGDEAEIDPGVFRLFEALGVEQHAYRGGDVRVVGLRAIIINPALHHIERGPRIDLRRDRRVGGRDQYNRCNEKGCVTHVMLPESALGRCEPPHYSGSMARKHLKRLCDIFAEVRFAAASKLWQAANA